MFDFLRRRRLLRRGFTSKKTRRRRTRNELLRSLEAAGYVKVIVLAAFIAGLAFLIFSGQQPEPTKNFVIALLFFATAIVQLWINRPGTFSQNSRVFLVFGTIFVQLAATKVILVLSSNQPISGVRNLNACSLDKTRMTLVAASWTKIVPKTRKTREFWENVPGRLIQSCTIAVAKNSNAITKFLVGSGCWPLKIRNANPAMKAARMKTFT